MSAYVVNRAHILYLVEATQAKRLNPFDYEFSWYHNGRRVYMTRPEVNAEALRNVAQMLWNANIHAVALRYPDSKDSLPGPTDRDYTIRPQDVTRSHWDQSAFDPVAVLKAIACYDYQTYEDPDYESSEAYAFLRALEHRAIRALPGWDDAPWGAPQPNMMAVNPPAGPR